MLSAKARDVDTSTPRSRRMMAYWPINPRRDCRDHPHITARTITGRRRRVCVVWWRKPRRRG